MSWLTAVRDRYRVVADPHRTERRIEIVVLLLIGLLILQLAYGASRLALMSVPEAVAPAADSLQVMSSLSLDTVTAERSNEIRSRPLLWPGRRPTKAVVKVPESKKGKPQELKGIKLLGVFDTGDSIGIILRVKDKAKRIHLGEEISGWTLQSVENGEAVFGSGSRQETLTLQPGSIKSAGKGKK